MTSPAVHEPRSQRSRDVARTQTMRPIDEIPVVGATPGAEATGAWAYYLRSDPGCATIHDIVHLFPNGGIPDLDNPRDRAAFGTNASEYREYYRLKGFEYVGQKLTEGAMERVVEIMQAARQEEVDWCLDQIDEAEEILKSGGTQQTIDHARLRRRKLQQRIQRLEQPFDPDALVAELKDIARAQMLASVDPNVLKVMKALIGEANDALTEKIAHFQRGATPDTVSDPDVPVDPKGLRPARGGRSQSRNGMDFEGESFLDRD